MVGVLIEAIKLNGKVEELQNVKDAGTFLRISEIATEFNNGHS